MPYDPRDEVYDHIPYDYGRDYEYEQMIDDARRTSDPPPRRPEPPVRTGLSDRELNHMQQQAAALAEYLAANEAYRQEDETRDGMTQAEWYANKAKMDVINNPNVTMTGPEKTAINDPKKVMTPQGKIVKRRRIIYPPINGKRTRKKTKMDKSMSKHLKMANAKARKKNGSMKKGWNQGRIMKEAHRLCRKHG